jgi:predicted nuclease of restriction endonuclease-like RecB superfamily
VFPTQLMMVRKSKKGTVRSVFLTEENSDYCSSVIELFRSSIGKKREDIEDSIKTLELKTQNPKIVRCLALILFRISRLEPPSFLNPQEVRERIFSIARIPAVSPEERNEILEKVAENLNATASDVRRAMYSDKESEQILSSVPDISSEQLSKRFNSEQIETVMLKATSVRIVSANSRNRIVRIARRLGLLYLENEEGIEITGPLSISDHSERYGVNFALLVRYMMKLDDWKMDVSVSLKDRGKKAQYIYSLDHSVFDYLEPISDEIPNGFVECVNPVSVKGRQILPDYYSRIGEKEVSIFITRPRFYQEDSFLLKEIRGEGLPAEIFCIVRADEKCPSGAICFRDSIDWDRVREYMETKYSERKTVLEAEIPVIRSSLTPEMKGKIFDHLKKLYPDSVAMVDYIEFLGLDPLQILSEAGYRIKWSGLRIVVL